MEALFGSTQAKAGEQKSNSFDVNSFVGSITSSSHTNHSSGIKKDVPQNHSKPQPKNPVSSQNTAKSTPKSSNHDAEKSRDSKDSQRGRDGYPGDSKAHKKESHSKESSHNDKGNTRPRHEDYSPLGGNSDKGGHDRSYGQHDSSFEGKIKKKPVENNEDDSFKIKKNPNAQPSSPKIKKVESSIPKKPEISKPKANPSPSHQTSVNTSMNKSSTQHSSSQGPSRDRPVSSQKSDRPNGSIPKKPLNGATQSSSKIPQRPPSSSPGPSKSLGTKPLPNGVKPANKSIPQKPSSMNSSTQKPSGVRPVPPKSTSPRPPVKPGSASTNGKPNSSQPMVKKPVPGGPPPAKPRPNSSQPPKPVPPGRTAPPGGLSQEALRKQKEEKMRREAAAKAKGPVTGGSNLVKRPMGNPPPSRLEPQVQKKPKTAQEQKMALNTVFKGSAKPRHRGYAGSDDDDYEKDSFIDDGEDEEEDEEAQRELGQMFHIYRDKAKKSKPFENDIDDMEVGYERIVREEKWSAKIARMEDEKELELIKKEQEDELKRQQKRKKKLQVED